LSDERPPAQKRCGRVIFSPQFGFDPLRTRLLFAPLMSPTRRRSFVSAVRGALAEPAPSPQPGDPWTDGLHAAWTKARRRAFEEVAALLERQDADGA
jgi:hypothetical protein